MTTQLLQAFFMWCSIINIGLLMLTFLTITVAKDWVYKVHRRWFDISKEHFDLVLYCFIGTYKLLVWIFCIIPWVALSIID